MRSLRALLVAAVVLVPIAPTVRAQTEMETPGAAIATVRTELEEVVRLAEAGDASAARTRATRIYLDRYEAIEARWAGPGAPEVFVEGIGAGEMRFHALLAAEDGASQAEAARALIEHLTRLEQHVPAGLSQAAEAILVSADGRTEPATEEIRSVLAETRTARASWRNGEHAAALAVVEHAYLEGIETLEPRLPSDIVRALETTIHLRLRPALVEEDDAGAGAGFEALETSLLAADAHLEGGSTYGFVSFNAFVIIVREGLEAALLIAAILACLRAANARPEHARRIWIGVAAGVAASFGTWVVARSFIPVTGAGREWLEGVTALIAVGVLLYVSHWIFRKTYLHDWKRYLSQQVSRAIGTGSGLAMAGLAFAAVYREGFETVLFYQALLFDGGPGPVLAGFAPGFLLIVLVGFAIVKLGARLPLRAVFAVTNTILLYLAFVFLGKGLYNLQEAGVFSARPVGWLPDSELLRQFGGLYPVQQTLTAQALFLALLVTTWAIYRLRMARSTPASAGA
jgi:high-affinity iron transporter